MADSATASSLHQSVAIGVSVPIVVLCVIGFLRCYLLQRRGSRPHRILTAAIPVSSPTGSKVSAVDVEVMMSIDNGTPNQEPSSMSPTVVAAQLNASGSGYSSTTAASSGLSVVRNLKALSAGANVFKLSKT